MTVNIYTVTLATGITTGAAGLGALLFPFVQLFRPFLPGGIGFAAGAMLWMVGHVLILEALEEAPARPVAVSVGLATLAMLLFQYLLKG